MYPTSPIFNLSYSLSIPPAEIEFHEGRPRLLLGVFAAVLLLLLVLRAVLHTAGPKTASG